MAKGNIWEDKSFEKLTADFQKAVPEKMAEPKEVAKSAVKRPGNLSKEAKKVTKWKDGLKEIIKKLI